MTEEKKFASAANVAKLGVLLALVIVLQAFGGGIMIGAVQLNFTLIPIVLGAVLLGWREGAFLGFACGVVVLIQVILGMSPFYTVIWTNSPVVTVLTCIVKTTVAGAVAGILYELIAKKNRYVAVFAASAAVPVINTGLFIVGCLCMQQSILSFQQSLPAEAGFTGMNVLVFILMGLVTFNFFIEFAINIILAPAIHTIVRVVEKRIAR